MINPTHVSEVATVLFHAAARLQSVADNLSNHHSRPDAYPEPDPEWLTNTLGGVASLALALMAIASDTRLIDCTDAIDGMTSELYDTLEYEGPVSSHELDRAAWPTV